MTAVAWSAIGLLAATLLGTLDYLGARLDALGARLDARIDGLEIRIDELEVVWTAAYTRFQDAWTTTCVGTPAEPPRWLSGPVRPDGYSHSIVPGGFEVTS